MRCVGFRSKRGVAALLAAVFVLVAAPSALAGGDGTVSMTATVDAEPIADADNGNPLTLGSESAAQIEVTVTNGTGADLAVERVRLEGTAFGVTFLAYDTLLPFTVDAGSEQTVSYEIPLNDLRDQATGLLPSSLGIYDADGNRIASQSFTLDVEGRTGSVMGVFAALVALITALAVGLNLYLVARRRLPANRIVRGLRFLVPGVGIGLLLALVLGMTRLLAPYNSVWPLLVLVPTVLGFLLGYASPGPVDVRDDYDEFDDLDDSELVPA